MNRDSRVDAYAALLGAVLLWASSFVALKIAFRSYHPMVVIFARMAVAILCSLFFIRRFRNGGGYQPGTLKPLLLMALCEPCLYFLFEAAALQNTSASQAGVIASNLPLLVAVAAAVVLKEEVRGRSWAGFIVAIAGSCWLSLGSGVSVGAPHALLGNFQEFLAMVCATGYIVTLKRLTLRYSPFFLTAVQALVGGIFYLPLLFLPSTELPRHWDATGIAAIFYLGAVVSLGAYGLYNYGVSRIPASQATAFINLIPVFTVILGWLVLGEQLNGQQYAATSLILGGVFLSQGR